MATTPKRRLPVMADVAKEAGVSHQTVSRVLNDHPNVRADTRARVVEAIAQLGYRPNLVARALVTKRSRTLGVVSFDTTLYGPASTIYGIEQAARTAGYFVSIVSLKSLDATSVRARRSTSYDRAWTGSWWSPRSARPAARWRACPPARRWWPWRAPTGPMCRWSASTSIEGARLATRHLLDLGHSTVWHVSRPAGLAGAEGRLAAGATTLEAAGRRCRRRCRATGARARATRPVGAWPRWTRSRRSSRPTTRWRSGVLRALSRRGDGARPDERRRVSTTSPRRSSSPRR